MRQDEVLQNVSTRLDELETHLLNSAEYVRRANAELTRRISYVYLAIGLLILTLAGFFFESDEELPLSSLMVIALTGFFSIFNCVLLLRARANLRRLNEAWLDPRQLETLATLKTQHQQIKTRLALPPDSRAEWN
jgi:tetrahydromethanopterin S-methyltransferase subunit G